MRIISQCPSCQKTLAVGEEHAGKKIRCPVCNAIVQLPERQEAADSGPTSRAQAPATARRKPADRRPISREESEPAPRPRQRSRKPASDSRPRRSSHSRRRPRRQRDPDDIWDRPLSSQGAPIPESAYDAYGLPPRKKKKKDRDDDPYRSPPEDRSARSSSSGFTSPLLIGFIICGGAALLAIAGLATGEEAPEIRQMLAMPAVVVGALFNLFGGLRVLGNAFSEDFICGFLYLFVPFYALYFLLSRWSENAIPFMMSVIGTVTFLLGVGALSG